LREFVDILRKVDGAQGGRAAHESRAVQYGLGQYLGQLGPMILQKMKDDAPKRPAVEADTSKGGAAGVERDDAPCVEGGPLLIQLVEIRMRHRKRAAVTLRLTMEGHAIAGLKHLADPRDATKPDRLHGRSGFVSHDDIVALS